MAMLAETRSRKGYTLTPRGKALYEDDTRFGTKMLEKMGWSKGKGLGMNEDGAKDFVRIRFKNKSDGLGYENRDDQWTEHADSFEGFLKSLNENAVDDENAVNEDLPTRGFGLVAISQENKTKIFKEKLSGESLEAKSKVSKARVHYKKFTKGKDLTQYSEKDLANIFGMKAGGENREDNTQNSLLENDETSTAVTITDYFKQKMALIKNKRKTNNLAEEVTLPKQETENEKSATEKKLGKKRKNKEVYEKSIEVSLEQINANLEPKAKKLKKSKKQVEINLISAEVKSNQNAAKEDEIQQEALDELEDDHNAPKTKRKKNKNENPNSETKANLSDSEHKPNRQKPKKIKKKDEIVESIGNTEQKKSKTTGDNETSKTTASVIETILNELSENKSEKNKNPEHMPFEDLENKLKSYDTYTISSFCAEKFRLADLNRFHNSSLPQIVGYSFNKNLKLNIKKIKTDEQRITKLWNCTLDKYKDAGPKNTYYNYVKEVRNARRTKTKEPRLHFKTWKRKQAFNSI